MSTYKHTFVVYGVRVDFDHDFCEAYHKIDDQCGDIGVIIDGMCGEYMVFGDILFMNSERDANESEEFKITKLSSLTRRSFAYRERFAKHFPDYTHLLTSKFDLITFVHYT